MEGQYFSDYFKVKREDLKKYGAFNISLVADLPLFIDPFLLFNSKKDEYKKLHQGIIQYLTFLKEKSSSQRTDKGALKAWYAFHEVEQNWLGFSVVGNKGSALGMDFAKALNENLHIIFKSFGDEKITKSSHLEKLCLIKDGVGRDNISDFATNLIKEFLLNYTQEFARKYIPQNLRGEFKISKVRFNYKTESWETDTFDLPKFNDDFVLLTPKDLLTRDNTWINRSDLFEDFASIPTAIPDDQLRFQINNYFQSVLVKDKDGKVTKGAAGEAAVLTIRKFPELIDYYIKSKEEKGDLAGSISSEKVRFSEEIYVDNVTTFKSSIEKLGFFQSKENSYEESKKKILILKNFIENNDGWKLFYDNKTKKRIKSEKDLQLLFALVCAESTPFDVNREVNNGRGPVDFKVSKGSQDKTLVEFKMANNKKLKKNLENQVEIYQKANPGAAGIKVIIYFDEKEEKRARGIIAELGLSGNENIVLIDARKDNKPSASNA